MNKSLAIFMTEFFLLLIRASSKAGARSLVPENLALRKQLQVLTKSRKRAPNLHSVDRVILAILAIFLRPVRLKKFPLLLKMRPSGSFTRQSSSGNTHIYFPINAKRSVAERGLIQN